MGKAQLKFSLSLVAVIVLIAVVVGVVAGRASGGTASGGGGGGGGGGRSAAKKVDVIIKASDSSFWQTMLAGARQASADYGVEVGLFGPTSEKDVSQQVQLIENSISRGADAIVLAPNSSEALNNAIKLARKGGMKVIVVDTAVTTDAEGFIGTDNIKAGEQAGRTLCDLVKKQGKTSGTVLIESSVAGIQTIKERETGFKRGFGSACPGIKVGSPRYNDNDLNTATSQVNDVLTANPNVVGVFASNNTSGVGAARAIKDNKAADRIPVVAFDTDPQENAALADGSIDALVVQNPYFFGYQGVIEAGMAAVGSLPPPKLDPGAVVATKANAGDPTVKPLLNPPTAKASS
jgi:ribose transport system substrate-binding protein